MGKQVLDMLGGRLEQVAAVTAHGDAVLFRTKMQPGRRVPMHSHLDPEVFYVLAGTVEVYLIDDDPHWRQVPVGGSLALENGVKHSIRNNSDITVELMVMTNRRLSDYFYRVGRLVDETEVSRAPTPEEIQNMIHVTKEFDYWIATPEDSERLTGQE